MTQGSAEPHGTRGASLLIEHVEALQAMPTRPTAHERLERIIGGYLARFLVGALVARRRR
jgi:hypothetical protein